MELHLAALQGDEKRILSSLLKGEEVDARDDENATPLHLAAWRGALAVCEALVAHGADVNAQDNQGSTPLHFAAQVLPALTQPYGSKAVHIAAQVCSPSTGLLAGIRRRGAHCCPPLPLLAS